LRPARPESGTGTQSALTPPSQGSTADKITSYVKQYNGGDCFFVTPVAISDRTAVIEGFGSSTKPFATLNTEFQRTIGFEPDIGLRQITEQECPAVTFLARLGGSNERAPRLDIDRDSLRNGDTLKGTIDRYGARDVQLILVSDSGAVENLSSLLKPGVDAKLFDIGMRRVDGSHGRQPQLLIAVASASPLEALRPGRTADARDYFTRALDESTRTGNPLSATAKYFMLEK
jgi:serine/threonine-protein kinase